MVEWKEYKLEEVAAYLEQAIIKLQENDSIFLDKDFDINERTVTHKLAIYLSELFPNEDVDCEYNRQYNEETDEFISKNVELPKVKPENLLKDIEATTVFPDIIVHKRQTGFNVLAIEVKMQWKNKKGDFDLIKAKAYKWQLKYQHSAYVVLGPNKEFEIKWIK